MANVEMIFSEAELNFIKVYRQARANDGTAQTIADELGWVKGSVTSFASNLRDKLKKAGSNKAYVLLPTFKRGRNGGGGTATLADLEALLI